MRLSPEWVSITACGYEELHEGIDSESYGLQLATTAGPRPQTQGVTDCRPETAGTSFQI